jgi:serine O-acetyltransferase
MPRPPVKPGELERAIDAIVSSYDGPEDINNLESAALPNRRLVIEAFEHIKAVIYLGFYSTGSLNRDNLRYSLSQHLYPAYEILTEQIARAVSYEQQHRCARLARAPTYSEDVVLRLFHGLPGIRRLLNSDVLAAYEGDPAAASLEEIIFSYPSIAAITAYRIGHVLHNEHVPMIPRIIGYYAHGRTGIDIHPGAHIGERFFIDHGTGVVIGETARIGNNVKMYQGVTLGALSARRSDLTANSNAKRHPTIEDNVTIYSGATILGGDTVIGENSTIGGNVWLVRSVPPNSKIFGRAKE